MNLIPESNGLYKVKNEHSFKKISKTKYVFLVLIGIILVGFISQQVSNFIGNEKTERSLNYVKIDNKKIEYNLEGQGDYTVVFVGATGTNLYEWDNVSKLVRDDLKIKTFRYNRCGYGFSDITKLESIEDQTEQLKSLLRKNGISNNIILVGEEYGSLIAVNFAKDYQDLVKGIVLVDPYDEEEIKSQDFQKKIKKLYYKTSIEQYGTYVYFTSILDKMHKAYYVDGFEEGLNSDALEEFQIHKDKKNYRQAVANEIQNLKGYDLNIMQNNMFSKIPMNIITKDSETQLTRLGSTELVNVSAVDDEKLLSVNSSENVYNSINNVLKQIKKIDKNEKNK